MPRHRAGPPDARCLSPERTLRAGRAIASVGCMRWDPSHESPDIDDRRASSGGGGCGGGVPLGGILSLASMFGWKGILIALLVVGGVPYGGGLCTGGGGPDRRAVSTAQRAPAGEEELK